MLTKGINFVNFKIKNNSTLVKKNLKSLLKSKNEILNSLSQNYKNSFSKKLLHKYKKKNRLSSDWDGRILTRNANNL